MEQAILTEKQRKAIEIINQEPNLADFYLSGGTALAAYYLRHRFSDDLDFFIFNEPDGIFLSGFAEKLKHELGADSVLFEKLYDRNQFFYKFNHEELKVEFTKYPFAQLEHFTEYNGIKIDSLRDIAANKLMAMLDRFDPKDFVDLFFLLEQFSLDSIRRDTESKFGIRIDDIFLGGELAKARRIEALPRMIKDLSLEELKSFFADQAEKLKPSIFE